MKPQAQAKVSIGLALITSCIAILMGMVIAVSIFAIERQQSEIEAKAQRIFDVAMPMVFESTKIIRGLEWLARDGESILHIDSAVERLSRRSRLQSILEDGVLQGDSTTRALVAGSFSILDQNLADLNDHGTLARQRALQRWEPVKGALFAASEKVGAQVSTAASDEADSIVESSRTARQVVLISSAALALTTVAMVIFLFFGFARPILRLSRFIKSVHAGEQLRSTSVFIREIQILSDAAKELATAHRELEENRIAMERMAHTDALTGLPNRRMFELRGSQEFDRARRYGESLAVVAFDIDHFKHINDHFSHEGGDAVLKALAHYLLGAGRTTDLPAARVGGEEFTLLLVHATLEEAVITAQRIREGVEKLKVPMPGGDQISLTASFGVTAIRPTDADLATVLHRADLALYNAKNSGRNCVIAES